MRIRIDPQPLLPGCVHRVVRVPDPWHRDAFAGTPAAGMGNDGPRRLTWQCEDGAGNLVADWRDAPSCPFGDGPDVTVEWEDDAWWWSKPPRVSAQMVRALLPAMHALVAGDITASRMRECMDDVVFGGAREVNVPCPVPTTREEADRG